MLGVNILEIVCGDARTPVLAIRMMSTADTSIAESGIDAHMLRSCGYWLTAADVVVMRLRDRVAQLDPSAWGAALEMRIGHEYIRDHYDALSYGAVVDVDYLTGQRQTNRHTIEEMLDELLEETGI
jgi:hypothetical protein